VHAEHHANDVEATAVHGRWIKAHLADDLKVFDALAITILDMETGIKESRRGASVMATTTATPTTARAQVSVSIPSLFNADVCRVKTNIELNRLWRLLPLVQIAALATSNVKHQQLLAAGATHLARSRRVVFIRRVALDDTALNPVVEDSQALDLTISCSPIAASLGDVVVVLSYDIIDATGPVPLHLGLYGSGFRFALSLELALTDGFALGLGYACARAGALLLSGLLGRGHGTALRRLELFRVVRLRRFV
jgi:hypothetical protein